MNYNPKSLQAEEFISHEEILETLRFADEKKNDRAYIESILERAKPIYNPNGSLHCGGLNHREASVLLACEIPDLNEKMIKLAEEIKLAFYGNRIVLFAPLYLSNYCVNGCTYCPYHAKNKTIARRKLTQEEIRTYILFQETYHKKAYEELHPTGPKHDYRYHTEAMDRAMEGGIDDVGIGVLFGLDKYRYEFAGLLMHAEHLEAVHGVGPHTISVPRLKKADDIDPTQFDNGIDDEIFSKIIACIRIAVPYTGMIISTRESEEVRKKALSMGISQISGASRTSVGGYTDQERPHDTEQFDVSDQRTLDEVVKWLMDLGYIPSFCTACYREGRTGDRFMALCKSGQIQNCCHPNALMTLAEYLTDYASPETGKCGEELIEKELASIPNANRSRIAGEHIKSIYKSNKRDFYF